eukprot:jgi/Mesvir1/14803/Mv05442-RA.1
MAGPDKGDRWTFLAKEAEKRSQSQKRAEGNRKRQEFFEHLGNLIVWGTVGKTASSPPENQKNIAGSVAVVGGGLSGLTAAYRLKKLGARVTVFDSSHIGGAVRSISEDGYIWEAGPNTMMENTPVVSNVISELGLDSAQRYPKSAHKRFIVRDGALVQLPSNPMEFLKSKILSDEAKKQVLGEPFFWQRRDDKGGAVRAGAQPQVKQDESAGDFFGRHFGKEMVDYLLDPFLAGTCGAGPEVVSVRHVFHQLWALEQSYGSLVVGGLVKGLSMPFQKLGAALQAKLHPNTPLVDLDDQVAVRPRRLPRKGLFSFADGMQMLPNAMAREIGTDYLLPGCSVLAMDYDATLDAGGAGEGGERGESGRWRVTYQIGQNAKKTKTAQFDSVLMTAPLHNLRQIRISKQGRVVPLDALPEVAYAPISVLVMAFRNEDVHQPVDGFGVLVPKKENMNILGTLFSSAMFPNRAPLGLTLLTTFIGGTRNAALAYKPREELEELVLQDLRKLLQVDGQPVMCRHIFWRRAFPVYGKGYDKVLNSMKTLERELPGLFLAGNHYGGLAVGKVIESGYQAAERIAHSFQHSFPASPFSNFAPAMG